ncbi:MAG: phosphate acetyltransferase [Culicoidibacterales bacterium]
MMSIFKNISQAIQGKEIEIVFTEGTDVRILAAARKLRQEGLVKPVLVGNTQTIHDLAEQTGASLEGMRIADPYDCARFEDMVDLFMEIRKGKHTREEAVAMLRKPNYFGTMLVKMGIGRGLVGGALYSTADTVRPALQIIKTKPGISKVASMFLMTRGDEKLIFGDCAINVNPSAEDLADIAVECSDSAPFFGISHPKVAMLSFSTKGSAKSPEVDKVVRAVELAQAKRPDLAIDGELQFDAAISRQVGMRKAPDSNVAGHANIVIFPTLDAGNIGYKIAQRLGGYDAIGPVLIGLKQPINDLSRGCTEEDIYKLAMITAMQVLDVREQAVDILEIPCITTEK